MGSTNITLPKVLQRKLLKAGDEIVLPPNMGNYAGIITNDGKISYYGADNKMNTVRTPRLFVKGFTRDAIPTRWAWENCRYRDRQAGGPPVELSLKNIYDGYFDGDPATERASWAEGQRGNESDEEDLLDREYFLPEKPHVLATVDGFFEENSDVPTFGDAAHPLVDVLAEDLWPGDVEMVSRLRDFVVYKLNEECCRDPAFYDVFLSEQWPSAPTQFPGSPRRASKKYGRDANRRGLGL